MEALQAFGASWALGMEVALTWQNLWYCLVGVTLGCMVGVLPGLGSLIAISLLLPITYHLPATGALIMLAGVYFGADYGGGTCSILLGVPGHPAAAVDVLDGYPMTKQGRGGVALFMKCIASFWGSSVGIVLLMFLAPTITDLALKFSPADYCGLMLLGLLAASTVGQGSPITGVGMLLVGVLMSTVGIDVNSGAVRFDLGLVELQDGLNLLALAMGVFAVAEVVSAAAQSAPPRITQSFTLRDQLPTREDWRRSWKPMLRGSGLGAFFGALPGTSGGMATFMAYSIEARLSKHPKEFGHGAIEGIAAPEACNNAGVGTAFIPTLTLGIPGDAVMALLLAALVIQGIQPGPEVMSSHPDLFWGLIVSFWIGNLLLVVLNIPLIGVWVRLLQIPYNWLFPAIVLFTCIGVYSTHNSAFDVYTLIVYGALSCAMLLLKLDAVPLLMGFILGKPLEENFRRAMLMSRGDFSTFVSSPVAAIALALCTLILGLAMMRHFKQRSRYA